MFSVWNQCLGLITTGKLGQAEPIERRTNTLVGLLFMGFVIFDYIYILKRSTVAMFTLSCLLLVLHNKPVLTIQFSFFSHLQNFKQNLVTVIFCEDGFSKVDPVLIF